MSEEKTNPAQANEYEREPVPENKTKGFKSFLGMFAGEHVAGTELLIGPLFLVHGVSAFDLLVGLLVGNLLAVLSWTFLTAPIAVKKRLTLYFQLEKIGGRGLIDFYNLASAVLWCFLAAAMISVSATAVGVHFHVKMPELGDMLPSFGMAGMVFAVGMVIAFVAAKGYSAVARFSNIAAPWMVVMFIVMGVAALHKLGIHGPVEFWEKAQSNIWKGGAPYEGYAKFTFWHVMFFSWFGNVAWHIGMADLSIFRFAKKARYGLASAAGMYLGHYIAWIAAGILYALQLFNNPENTAVAPGPMAYGIAGTAGIILVLVAGWTTANPMIYRAGLAFQALRPNWSRFKVTISVGALACLIGIFPGLSTKFLQFAALYGLVLMPMGAVIFVDFYWMKRLGMTEFYAEKAKTNFHWPPALAWVISLLACVVINVFMGIQVFFLALPAWFITAIIYIVLSKRMQKQAVIDGANS